MKILIMAIILAFASPSLAASTTTWNYHKSGKYWTVKTNKHKSTLEIIKDLKKHPRKTKATRIKR